MKQQTMISMKKMAAVIFLMVQTVLPGTARAEALMPMQTTGKVDSVDTRHNTIVVKDMTFMVTSSSKVYSLKGNVTGLYSLSQGMQVEITALPAPRSAGNISGIVISLQRTR